MQTITCTKIQFANNKISICGKEISIDQAYTFVHDLQEPNCNHFQYLGTPKILEENTNKCVFQQSYSYLTDIVNVEHSITVSDNILWRMKQIDPEIKAILISGYTDNPDLKIYKTHGFDAMLEKPFSIKGLNQILRNLY